MKSERRMSGVELLRIITAMGVVLLHYNDGRAFEYVDDGSINQMVLFLLESLCICAVDLFVLISGYFLSVSQKRDYFKPLELIVQFIVFREVIYIGTSIICNSEISIMTILIRLLPKNYYVILYCTLYVISPYLNAIFEKFDNKAWIKFMLINMALFSVWPTVVDLLGEIQGKEMIGISTIGRLGAQKGFNIVNFILLYFVGAFLNHYQFPDKYKKMKKGKYLLAGGMFFTVIIFLWTLAVQDLERSGLRSAWVYHNPFVILMAVVLFLLFKDMCFESQVINELAKAAFTCFIFHGTLLNYMQIEKYSTGNVFVMMIHIFMVIVTCYFISYIAYKMYDVMVGWIWKWGKSRNRLNG